jgi:hypothetical protein
MKTCYDCLHYDACSDAGDSGFSSLKEDVSKCKHFKNKADFVEVVRCRDCANRNKSACPNLHFSDISGENQDFTEDDDFCSYGERSEHNG